MMNRVRISLAIASLALLLPACATLQGAGSDAQGAAAEGPGTINNSAATAVHLPGASNVDAARTAAQANTPPEPVFSPAPVLSKGEQLLADGLELYEKGDFKAAIRKLTGARDSLADNTIDLQTSLKYLAFSYCVTGQKTPCKAQFAALLKIAPDFQLSRAEAGHPQWGPVFKETRAGTRAGTTTASSAVK